MLSYFVHEKDVPQSPKDSLPLLATTLSICSKKIEKPYSFQLTYNRRNYFFVAEDGKSLIDWINCIRAAKAKCLGIDEALGDPLQMQRVCACRHGVVLSLWLYWSRFNQSETQTTDGANDLPHIHAMTHHHTYTPSPTTTHTRERLHNVCPNVVFLHATIDVADNGPAEPGFRHGGLAGEAGARREGLEAPLVCPARLGAALLSAGHGTSCLCHYLLLHLSPFLNNSVYLPDRFSVCLPVHLTHWFLPLQTNATHQRYACRNSCCSPPPGCRVCWVHPTGNARSGLQSRGKPKAACGPLLLSHYPASHLLHPSRVQG